MAYVIYDIALYSVTEQSKIISCPWRYHLSNCKFKYKDLNYGTAPNINAVLEPLNSWIGDTGEPLTPGSFPFLIYQIADSQVNDGTPRTVYVRNIIDLQSDEKLNSYDPNA
jgi:hypothetical protein